MNRLKFLVAAALLGLPLAACDSETAPPPVGQIDGQVVIEGEGIDGVSVSLSSGAATTTSGGGHYSFMDVEGGTYTITISGYPDDASFDQTTAEVTIASSGQTINRSFSGSWIRTASLMGMVTVEGEGLPGVTVAISGRQEAQMLTDDNGQYTFTGLRAGNYTVEISGFDATDVAFSATSSAVEVSVGESKVWSFDGTYVRESAISGQVSVEGNGLAGVTVTLQGMGADESENTDMGGQFTFSNLRAGEYQLAISGFDTREYGFSTTSATVRVEHGRTANVPFEGIMLRTASIMGQVSIEGEGLADVTVSLSGEGESLTTMTDNSGQYAFSKLPAGNFQVGISGYDTDDYSFETTSKNVALALGETATVPFEGILLRTSGISGRVSVEGMGLDSVTVTLSGDDLEEDMTTMTDATGQYAIAGLAEGEYTVAISDYDDVAYVFETTSMDVDLGDDDTQIVNFMGTHARTASVTVQMFVDEGTKNDMRDAGEHSFPSAEMIQMVMAAGLPLPLDQIVSLMGPGVLEEQTGTTTPDGQVVFSDLRAGDYQLVVSDISADLLAALPPALATVLQDYAYGGSAMGYTMTLEVGEAASKDVPIDITHTTVNFLVRLRGGGTYGEPIPGAMVDLYSDEDGETKIGTGTTYAMGDHVGVTRIRFERDEDIMGNTVYASFDTDYLEDPTADLQAVTWNPMSPMHPVEEIEVAPGVMAAVVPNEVDIVNLDVNVTFGGATVTTAHPESGEPLAGWEISVTHGGDAVEGADEELDDDGEAGFKTAVMPTDLPATFMIAVADNQNDKLDGGENYEADALMHTHTGLSLARAMDAGTIEVAYTTQTLKVYVHEERDQVMGYSANVQGGDERMSGRVVDVEIRYAENGARHRFTPDDSIGTSYRSGVYTFSNVPADKDVIAIADEADQDEDDDDYQPVMVLDPDEVPAYTGVEANGIMGGAFGDLGGFSHTVSLCPLMSRDTDQRFREDNCGTFGYVETYQVTGQVWKNVVTKRADDFALGTNREVIVTKSGVPGFTVHMDPVDGENLAAESAEPFEAARATNLKFDFGQMPAGVYTVTISGDENKWNVRRGPVDDPTDDLEDRINPLDSILNIDVAPKTGYVYGAVTDAQGKRAAGVTVDVNGVKVETDAQGRYIAEGFLARSYRFPNATRATRNRTIVRAHDPATEAFEVVSGGVIGFAANTPRRVDFSVSAAGDIAEVSGTVTHSNGGAGVGGVEILVDGAAPLNASYVRVGTREVRKLLTDANGSYTARITATGGTVAISAKKDFMFFTPDEHTVSAVKGAEVSGINFSAFDNGTISGRVVDGDGDPLSGVIVSATEDGATTAAHADTTGAAGSYVLRVPYGRYNVAAVRDGYDFTELTDIAVPNDGTAQDNIEGTAMEDNANLYYLHLTDVSLCQANAASCPRTSRGFQSTVRTYYATVANSVDITTVTAEASVHGADVEVDPGDDSSAGGHQVDLEVGDNEITVTVTALDGTTDTYTITVTRLAETTIIEGTITDSEGDGISAVFISVSGRRILNPNWSSGRYRTNSAGEFSVQVESGGTATVTPSKTGYTFDPASRSVTLAANATITGIDFEGAANGAITGRVTDGTSGLADATVSVTPRDGGGTARTATTRASGRFTVGNVSIGWNTVSVTKAGYTFESRDVHVSGGTVDIGDLVANSTLMPLNVAAERDTAADGSYDGSATVTWDQGVSGAADAYRVQRQEGDTWAEFGDLVETLTNGEGMSTGTTNLPAGSDTLTVTFRVLALTEDPASAGSYTDTLASATASVGPVNPMVTNVQASRAVDPQPDSLDVTWEARGDSESDWRVVISFDGGTTWHVANATATGGRWMVTLEATSFAGMSDVGSDPPTTTDATDAQLEGAFMIRVDYRQRATRGDGSTAVEWTAGPTASVGAK